MTEHNAVMVVGGNCARPSKLIQQISEGISVAKDIDVSLSNGDPYIYFESLVDALKNSMITVPDIIFWLADIPNSIKRKLIDEIKPITPNTILIGSKRLDDRDIGLTEVIQRMLKTKMNLCIVIDKPDGDRYRARLIDPLGNCFYDGEDFKTLGMAAISRALYLKSVHRVGSKQIGKAVVQEVNPAFLSLIHRYADEFDRLVQRPKEVERFLGNAAFRCNHGMPAFRSKDYIYISKRNVDKSGIDANGFVAIKPFEYFDSSVSYYGDKKPSVDAPIDLLIFNYFSEINYLIHGHVYLVGAHHTEHPIPCGAIEEFEAIIKSIRYDSRIGGIDSYLSALKINLSGHGFIAGAKDLSELEGLKFYARPSLESGS